MLLKAIIFARTGTVHAKGEKYTYGFDKCLQVAEQELFLISPDECATLSILDAHRDTAIHYYHEMSEDLLYLQAQASVTLFDQVLHKGFEQRLADMLPSRVLPISTRPPKDLRILLDSELSQVDELLKIGKRATAAARLRPVLAFATASREEAQRVTEPELRKVIHRRRKGEAWSVILPEIAQLKLSAEGDGIPIVLKIKKDAEIAVRIAKPGEAVVGTVIKQSVDWFDKYNLGVRALAKKLGISIPKLRAYMFEIKLRDDPEMFGTKKINSQVYNRYTPKALEVLREVMQRVTVEEVWTKHRASVLGRKKRAR